MKSSALNPKLIAPILAGWLVALGILGGAVLSAPPKMAIGAKAPDFALTDLKGQTHRLADYVGKKVVLLQFWATWCPHCRDAMGAMTRLAEDYEKHGAFVLGVIRVTKLDPEEQIRAFAAGNALPYDVIMLDRDGAVADLYGARGVPDTLVIDRAGTLMARNAGSDFPAGPEIRRAIETALAALPDSTFKARSMEELTRLYPPPPRRATAAPAAVATPAPAVPQTAAPPAPQGLRPADEAYVHMQLAIAYLNIGDRIKSVTQADGGYYKMAVDELQKAATLDPTNRDIFYWLGLAFERTGDFAQAARYYRKALESAEDARATDSLRRLGSLR